MNFNDSGQKANTILAGPVWWHRIYSFSSNLKFRKRGIYLAICAIIPLKSTRTDQNTDARCQEKWLFKFQNLFVYIISPHAPSTRRPIRLQRNSIQCDQIQNIRNGEFNSKSVAKGQKRAKLIFKTIKSLYCRLYPLNFTECLLNSTN